MANKNPIPQNPELLDLFFSQVQKGLTDNLPWLDKAFGKAERLVKKTKGKLIYTPNVYNGGNDYIEVSPDSNIGNFSFFWVTDPQEVENVPHQFITISTQFSLIVWFNCNKVFNNTNTRNKEAVKRQILDLLNGGILLKSGSMEINRVYELAENIYNGFSLDEVDNQFLMQPYCGFRFEGKLRVTENCLV